MVWASIVQFFAEYLKTKPFSDVLMLVLIGVFVWSENSHGARTDRAHSSFAEVIQEREAASERNTDRIISALTGVRRDVKDTTEEVKKIPVAAAVAAKKIVDSKVTDAPDVSPPCDQPKPEPPGIDE